VCRRCQLPMEKKKSKFTCKWASKKKARRCSKGKFKRFCKKSCGSCSDQNNPLATPVLSPTNSPPSSDTVCTDNAKFRWKGVEEWDCAWVARDKTKRCERERNGHRVKDQCRWTCGTCSSDIAAPIIAVSDPSPNESSCTDDPHFLWRELPQWDCAWVAADKDKRCPKEQNGVQVKDHCRKTCDSCSSSDAPGGSPAESPIPNENISDSLCADDSTFIWRDNPSWTCEWVAQDKNKRCAREKDGLKIEDSCRATCAKCNLTV